jgi:diguanylate cyclase (GGDEF)-like protein
LNSYLQVCKTLEETYAIIVNYVEKLFEHCTGAFYMFNENHTSLKSVVSWGDDDYPPPVITSDDCWALRQSKPHIVERENKSILCHHIKACPENGYICAPAIAQGEMIGFLHVGFPEPPENETFESQWLSIESRMRVVSITADNLAMALVSLKLREELRNQSVRDPLTKLFNRRYMEEALELEISRSERSGSELGVVIMDMDHFKSYNDTYGHSAGDQVLSTIAETIQGNLRKEDVACRYGGEEIVLILPGIPREVLVNRVDRLREAIGNTELNCRGVTLPNVTVSIGVSSYPFNGSSGNELIRLADEALYRAKDMGRNQVIVTEGYANAIDNNEEDKNV